MFWLSAFRSAMQQFEQVKEAGMNSLNSGDYQYLFKVVLLGNSSVGKSSITNRYTENEFNEVFLATIGVDFKFKSFSLNGNKIKLQIWDTAGHERFRTITSSYYKGARALMIVFDITDKQSFDDAINYWYREISNQCPPQTQVLLIGNKSDLQEKRVVTRQDIDAVLEKYREIRYIETSAKTSDKIEQAFHTVAGMLVNQQQLKKEAKSDSLNRKSGTKLSRQDSSYSYYNCCRSN